MIPGGRTRVAGIIGWPVAHSRSPRLHGHWLERYGIDGAYLPLPVPPGKVGVALAALPLLGIVGVNVTLPHKQAALAAMDRVDAQAERIGAVNTVVVVDGVLVGSNTDAFGFIASLDADAPDWRRDRPAVVLGAGGAARAVIAGLQDSGVGEIRLCNRTRAHAEAVAGDLGEGVAVVAWDERDEALAGAGLLVNATTLGMDGKPALAIALDALDRAAVVADIVYVPLRTELLRRAGERGLKTVDGLGMLLHQARPGFAAWFGRQPEVDEDLRRAVLADLAR